MKKQHKYWYRYRKKSRLGSIGIGIENTRLVWYRLGLGLDAKIMVSPYSILDSKGSIHRDHSHHSSRPERTMRTVLGGPSENSYRDILAKAGLCRTSGSRVMVARR